MDIAAMNEKIVIQKNSIVSDSVGNHIPVWTDFFTCNTTAGGEDSSVNGETDTAGQTVESGKISFTIRWCGYIAEINSTEYRVIFHGELYDICNVNHQNFRKHSLKLICRKCSR